MEDHNEQKIEQLRTEMINAYLTFGDLTNSKVVEISQKLDVYLVKVQRQRKSKKHQD